MFDIIVGGVVTALATAMMGLVAWIITLGTRVSVVENTVQSDKDHIEELLEVRFDAVDDRLSRIEGALNGYLHQYNERD